MAGDKVVVEAQSRLADLLTRELNLRPEQSLVVMYQSLKVQGMIAPIIERLEKHLGYMVEATTESVRLPDGKRRVNVVINRHPGV